MQREKQKIEKWEEEGWEAEKEKRGKEGISPPILISKIWHLCFPDYLPTLLLDPFTRFDRTPTCDRQMQTERQLAMARTTLV